MKQYLRVSRVAWATGILICPVLLAGCGPGGLFSGFESGKIQAQTHYTQTSDGWALQVDHFEPITPNPKLNPVVLCHGLSYNSHFWNLSKKTALL